MLTKCSCKHCGGHIEFESEHAGTWVECPHCQIQTPLKLPAPVLIERTWEEIQQQRRVYPPSIFEEKKSLNWLWWVAGAIAFFGFIGFTKAMGAEELLGPMLLLVVGGVVYFIPSVVGRNKKNANAILMLNLFLGWTFIGWVVALVWACTKD